MKTYLLAAVVLLAGCNGESNPAAKLDNAFIQYEGTPTHYAYEFRLMDGTRCVAYGDAITCQWPTVIINPKVQ